MRTVLFGVGAGLVAVWAYDQAALTVGSVGGVTLPFIYPNALGKYVSEDIAMFLGFVLILIAIFL